MPRASATLGMRWADVSAVQFVVDDQHFALLGTRTYRAKAAGGHGQRQVGDQPRLAHLRAAMMFIVSPSPQQAVDDRPAQVRVSR